MLDDEKRNKLPEKVNKSIRNAVRVLLAGRKEISPEEQLRKGLYTKLLSIALLLFCGGLLAVILLRLPQILLFTFALSLGFIIYITMLEMQEMDGNLVYVLAKCDGKTKTMNVPGKPLFAYLFTPVHNPDVPFFLSRTEELGFIEGMTYIFCFKGGENATMSNEDLVNYVAVNNERVGEAGPPPAPIPAPITLEPARSESGLIKFPMLKLLKRTDNTPQDGEEPAPSSPNSLKSDARAFDHDITTVMIKDGDVE